MAGVAMSINLNEALALEKDLKKSLQKMRNLNTLLDKIGSKVESQTRRRIIEEKESPDGRAWDEWSDNYAQTRQSGHSLLEGEGDLLDSIHYKVQGDKVEVGSNLIYAAIHQFGGDEVGMSIPARPYLGLSAANSSDIAAVVKDWLEKGLR